MQAYVSVRADFVTAGSNLTAVIALFAALLHGHPSPPSPITSKASVNAKGHQIILHCGFAGVAMHSNSYFDEDTACTGMLIDRPGTPCSQK